jgi:hypothetical protein
MTPPSAIFPTWCSERLRSTSWDEVIANGSGGTTIESGAPSCGRGAAPNVAKPGRRHRRLHRRRQQTGHRIELPTLTRDAGVRHRAGGCRSGRSVIKVARFGRFAGRSADRSGGAIRQLVAQSRLQNNASSDRVGLAPVTRRSAFGRPGNATPADRCRSGTVSSVRSASFGCGVLFGPPRNGTELSDTMSEVPVPVPVSGSAKSATWDAVGFELGLPMLILEVVHEAGQVKGDRVPRVAQARPGQLR